MAITSRAWAPTASPMPIAVMLRSAHRRDGHQPAGLAGHQQARPVTADERTRLRPLPTTPFELVTWHQARVHRDSHIEFDGRLYSVPWRLVGQRIWVRATPTSVQAYADDVRVATHPRRGASLRSTVAEHLPEHREPWRHRSRAYWEERADRIAPEVGAYVRELFDSDEVLSMLRTVQAVVTHLETFPPERAARACARASHYGSRSYATIKNILRQGLDLAPLPTTSAPTSSLTNPRFARPVGELHHAMETRDGLN